MGEVRYMVFQLGLIPFCGRICICIIYSSLYCIAFCCWMSCMSGGTWLVRLMLILIYTQLQATVTTHYQVVMMMIVDIMALSSLFPKGKFLSIVKLI